MADGEKKGGADSRSAIQSAVFYSCIALTFALLAAIILFTKQYSKNQAYVVSRAIVLKGVEPPAEAASDKSVRDWIAKYSAAAPGCVCALGRTNASEKSSALLLCIGYSRKRGAAPACVIEPAKLPAGVSMTASPHSKTDFRIKFIYILSTFTNSGIISPRTGRL